jgi:hypothetical protein
MFPVTETSTIEPASELRRIPLAAIKIDPAIQQRVAGTSQEVVQEYAQAMRDGNEFPPPTVFSPDGVTYHLGDGFHQAEAYRLAHPDAHEIACEVRYGGHDDALEYACGANASHGLQRTTQDKRKAILTLLDSKNWAQRGDREIARQCKVSHPLVAKVRREYLESNSRCRANVEKRAKPQLRDANAKETAAGTEARRRTVTRRGKSYPMSTARIGATRATASRPKTSEATPPLTLLAWSIATKPDRGKHQRSRSTRNCRSD